MTDRDDIRRAIRALRAIVIKRDRLKITGHCEYQCSCGASIKAQICKGVVPREFMSDPGGYIPAPECIPCSRCDQQMSYVMHSFRWSDQDFDLAMAFVRIPSRKHTAILLQENRYEAQYVDPVGHGPRVDRDAVEQWGDAPWED